MEDIKYNVSEDESGKLLTVNSETSNYNIEISIHIKDDIYEVGDFYANKQDIKYNLRLAGYIASS